MKLPKLCSLLLCSLTLTVVSACSASYSDNRKAADYAERLETGEAISADEYSEIVTFYCNALDRAFSEMEPAARAHADAVEAGSDQELIERTAEDLKRKAAEAGERRRNLTRLGNALFLAMPQLPDSARTSLVTYLQSVSSRYSDF